MPAKSEGVQQPKRIWTVFGLVFLCFAGSFLGAWLFLATGLVRPDVSRTLTENRENIVSQEGEIVADVFKKVSPSTVAITTQSVAPANYFFGERVSEGAGSGVIISKDGYVITNKHVVPEGVDDVTVVLHDGTKLKDVKILGRDPSNDLAFLKIEGADNLKSAQIGDSNQINPGQKVVAIGNALGIFRNSVTSGIISGIGRPIQAMGQAGTSEKLENLFQTDAAINPGNSGGPLVNLKGEVIGINTAISEEGEAIGFAIPINDAKGMIKSVVNSGKINKPYLGVRYITLTAEIAEQLKTPVSEGALLKSGQDDPAVAPNGPAAQAGLKENDILLKVNGQEIGQGSLASKLAQYAPGDEIEITILRDNNQQNIKVTLGEYPQ